MKCNDCIDKLSIYIDNELSEIEVCDIEKHLESCVECQETLQVFRQMQEEIRNVSHIQLPEGFHDQLMHTIQNETKVDTYREKKSKTRIMSYLSAVAAALLIVWIGNGVAEDSALDIPMVTQEESKSDMNEKVPFAMPAPKSPSMRVGEGEEEAANRMAQNRSDTQEMAIAPMKGMLQEVLEEEVWEIEGENQKDIYEGIVKIAEEQQYSMEGIPYSECLITLNTIEEKENFKTAIVEQLKLEIQIKESIDTRTIRIILSN